MENNNHEIIVETKEEQKRLTFHKWIKGIVHYKWWVVGSTLVVGLIGALGVQFVLNVNSATLSADFINNLATIKDENNVERYVDGTLFNYSTIVSTNNLENVKKTNQAFSKINVERLTKDNAITVIENKTEEGIITSYSIKAKAKYFPSNDIGKQYLQALIMSPKANSASAIEKFEVTSYISSDFENMSYQKKVNLLQKQDKEINETYENITNKFGGSVIANTSGGTLAQIYSDFSTKTNDINVLLNSFYVNGYVDYEVGKEQERINEIKQQAESNIKIYETKEADFDVSVELLKTMQATIINTTENNDYSKELIKLKNKITALSSELDQMAKDLNWAGYYKNTDGKFVFNTTDKNNACYQLNTLDAKWIEENSAYNNKLIQSSNLLNSERNEATSIFKYVYSAFNNDIFILNSGYIKLTGGISWVIGAVIGIVLGFLISSFITGEVEVYRERK